MNERQDEWVSRMTCSTGILQIIAERAGGLMNKRVYPRADGQLSDGLAGGRSGRYTIYIVNIAVGIMSMVFGPQGSI